MVEVTRFELAASCSQSKHSTKLSYTSKEPIWFFHYSILSAFCQVFSRRKKDNCFPYCLLFCLGKEQNQEQDCKKQRSQDIFCGENG